MAAIIDTVLRFKKVEDATSTKDEPAPVYLLDEIVALANSSPESAQGIADHVIKRLGNKSPIVKFKALRLVKHLCLKGALQFQRCMQRHSGAIRELQHYRGEQDPLKGDAPNHRVRELAKETTEVLFSVINTAQNSSLSNQGRIQGFGSGVPEGRSGPPSTSGGLPSGGSKYVGFGSTPPPSSTPSYSSTNPTIASAVASVTSAASSAMGAMGLLRNTPTERSSERSYDSPPRTFDPPTYTSGPTSIPLTASQVMGSEEQLVDDICTPGGLRAVPDPEDLSRFVAAASNMDGLQIGDLLRQKMEQGTWQVQLRAMAVLHAVAMQGGVSQAHGEIVVLFQSDATPLRNALQSPQPSLRLQAAKTLSVLLNEEVTAEPLPSTKRGGNRALATGQSPAGAPAAPVADLLMDDDLAAGSAPQASGLDLLGDFGGPNAPQVAVAPGVAATASMFSGLQLEEPASHAARHVQQPAAPTAQNGDLFGGLQVNPVPPPQPPQGGSLMSLSPEPSPAHAAGSRAAPLDELFAGLQPSAGLGPTPVIDAAPRMTPFAAASVTAAAQAPAGPPVPVGGPPADLLGGGLDLLGPDGGQVVQPGPSMQAGPGMQPGLMQPPMMVYGGQVPYGMAPGGMLAVPPGMVLMPAGMSAPQPYGVPMAPPGAFPQQYGMPRGMAPPPYGAPAAMGPAAGGTMAYGGMAGAPGQLPVQDHMGGHPYGALGMMPHGGHGTAAGPVTWQGKDDVSVLMRSVASGGKHDPAFDFVKDELKAKR